jgi:sulfite oxidase
LRSRIVQTTFGGGVPIEKAMRPETMIALRMNGQPLSRRTRLSGPHHRSRIHRARSVKWLGRVIVSDRSSENNFVARDYKMFPPEATPENVKPEQFGPIYEMVLGSAICSPRAGDRVTAGRIVVRGLRGASGRARRPRSPVVEVSADDGKTWTEARFRGLGATSPGSSGKRRVTVAAGTPTVVRATDSGGKTQPERAAWNFKGYLNDSCTGSRFSAS